MNSIITKANYHLNSVQSNIKLQILDLVFKKKYSFSGLDLLREQFAFFNQPSALLDARTHVLMEWLSSQEQDLLFSSLNDKFNCQNSNHRQMIIKSFIDFLLRLRQYNKNSFNEQISSVNFALLESREKSNFDKMYSHLLKKSILSIAKKSKSNKITCISFGSAGGVHEEKANQEISFALKNKNIEVSWVGCDIYPFFDGFFSEQGNKFELISPVKANTSWKEYLQSKIDQPVLLNLIGVVHHMELSASQLSYFIKGAQGCIIYDEPINLKYSKSFWNYNLQLVYDLLANISFNNDWAKNIYKDHTKFSAQYLVFEELEEYFKLAELKKRSPRSYFGVCFS